MRIAMISTPFVDVPPSRYGGTELVISALVDALAARGHEVVLYATGGSRARGVLKWHYPTAWWPPDPMVELTHASWSLADLLASEDVDVIHAHVAPVLAFAPFLEVPVIYTVHHERDPSLSELYKWASQQRVSMVAISKRQCELLEDVCSAQVIHHGLDPSRYPLGLGQGRYVAFLGRFAREKGVHAALDAAERAHVPIRLAGRPHYPKDAEYYDSEIRPRLLAKGVVWQGEVDHEQKGKLLGGALATLSPIDWEEPFGLVMLESMLCGTPVVSFAKGSAPELIEEGVTGFLVSDIEEMAATVRRLMRSGFDRMACRTRAAAQFGVGRMVEAYLAVYGAAERRAFAPQVVPS